MFCEQCGMNFLPEQSLCGHCGVSPTRHWLQLVSLVVLTIALACNSLMVFYLLPDFAQGERASPLLRSWLWFGESFSLYGWVPVALALLTWAFWPRLGWEPEGQVWFARVVLVLALVLAGVKLLLRWIPGATPAALAALVTSHAAAASTLPWLAVLLAVAVLCTRNETRDRLLGDGRALSLTSLAALFLVLVLMLVGWLLA